MPRYKGLTNEDVRKLDLYERIMVGCQLEDGHLIWPITDDESDYPIFHQSVNGKNVRIAVRRFLWLREYKKDVAWVLNECGVRGCVLPAHQYDLRSKQPKEKIRVRRVKKIRALRAEFIKKLGSDGYGVDEIAFGLGVPLNLVSRLINH